MIYPNPVDLMKAVRKDIKRQIESTLTTLEKRLESERTTRLRKLAQQQVVTTF